MSLPVLYSFRRCPYAIRARLAMAEAKIKYVHREIVLKDKPPEMLLASPKATVPVLVLEKQVIDESIEIMQWALEQSATTSEASNSFRHYAAPGLKHPLVKENDFTFKPILDRYKYFDRYPESSQQQYFDQAISFLEKLDKAISSKLLDSSSPTCLDHAIFPFIRQFAFVDKPAFDGLPLAKLQQWFSDIMASQSFDSVMKKYPKWEDSQSDLVVDYSCVEPIHIE